MPDRGDNALDALASTAVLRAVEDLRREVADLKRECERGHEQLVARMEKAERDAEQRRKEEDSRIEARRQETERVYLRKDMFEPYRIVISGLVGLILLAVVGAWIAQVVVK